MRRVWIEIVKHFCDFLGIFWSPSMRRVWIEIFIFWAEGVIETVTLHAEGVD